MASGNASIPDGGKALGHNKTTGEGLGLTRAQHDISRRTCLDERRPNSTTDRPPHNFLITEMCFTLAHPAARNLQARRPWSLQGVAKALGYSAPKLRRPLSAAAAVRIENTPSRAIAPDTGRLRQAALFAGWRCAASQRGCQHACARVAGGNGAWQPQQGGPDPGAAATAERGAEPARSPTVSWRCRHKWPTSLQHQNRTLRREPPDRSRPCRRDSRCP